MSTFDERFDDEIDDMIDREIHYNNMRMSIKQSASIFAKRIPISRIKELKLTKNGLIIEYVVKRSGTIFRIEMKNINGQNYILITKITKNGVYKLGALVRHFEIKTDDENVYVYFDLIRWIGWSPFFEEDDDEEKNNT